MIFKKEIDLTLFLCTFALMLLSIAFVYSASASIAEARFGSPNKLFINHTIRVLIAFVVLFLTMKIDYHVWSKYSKIIMFLSLLFLFLVFFISEPINGAYRWINFGPINFQPSELSKFALVLHFATLLTQRQEVIKDFKFGFLPLFIWTILICTLIALQPNFSTATVIFLITVTMMFIGNINLKHLFSLFAGAVSVMLLYSLSAPYRAARLKAYLNFSNDFTSDTSSVAIQSQQAIIALGHGGIFGMGPGQSRQSSLFLPEAYGDFIFSIIGEEYGFIGSVVIILIFFVIIYKGIRIARRAKDLFGFYVAAGITITIALYTFISIAVNIGLLPTTGLPLPLISYGGTAIIFYAAVIGILLNISANK